MCIAIVTNSHKDYPLILLSNRDVGPLLVLAYRFDADDLANRNTCNDPQHPQNGGMNQTITS
jgi:hypothetical protein